MGILVEWKRLKLNNQWRKHNPYNQTRIGIPTNPAQMKIGDYTYGMLNVLNESTEYWLEIGRFCSIAPEVTFIVESDHPVNHLSTFPMHRMVLLDQTRETISKGSIRVEDDVWIGFGATILSGVRIGQGAVIAAGAVVVSEVAPYSVAAGIPAKTIKYRFEPPVIDFLMTLDYGKLTEEQIKAHIDEFYTPIDQMALEEIKALYSWFPKKSKTGQ